MYIQSFGGQSKTQFLQWDFHSAQASMFKHLLPTLAKGLDISILPPGLSENINNKKCCFCFTPWLVKSKTLIFWNIKLRNPTDTVLLAINVWASSVQREEFVFGIRSWKNVAQRILKWTARCSATKFYALSYNSACWTGDNFSYYGRLIQSVSLCIAILSEVETAVDPRNAAFVTEWWFVSHNPCWPNQNPN